MDPANFNCPLLCLPPCRRHWVSFRSRDTLFLKRNSRSSHEPAPTSPLEETAIKSTDLSALFIKPPVEENTGDGTFKEAPQALPLEEGPFISDEKQPSSQETIAFKQLEESLESAEASASQTKEPALAAGNEGDTFGKENPQKKTRISKTPGKTVQPKEFFSPR